MIVAQIIVNVQILTLAKEHSRKKVVVSPDKRNISKNSGKTSGSPVLWLSSKHFSLH